MIVEVRHHIGFKGFFKSYHLSDFAYGEWLIYQNNYPIFHFHIFTPEFQSLLAYIKERAVELEVLVLDALHQNGFPDCTLSDEHFGICYKSKMQNMKIPLLPASFFQHLAL